jgi:hypothetical protein
MTGLSRKYMAVSDETEECVSALLLAGMKAKSGRAGMVILRCARMPGLGGWVGLDKEINQDAIDSARLKAMKHVDLVEQKVGIKAELIISDEEPVDAIRKAVDGDSAIKELFLASASGWRPGPLVSRLGRGKPVSTRPIAVTVIPGRLSEELLRDIGGFGG